MKKKKPSTNPNGRTPLDIPVALVEKWARAHCTYQEIADMVGCSEDTILRRFADVVKRSRAEGKTALRLSQYMSAEKGNTEMLKWLGRIILKQKPEGEQDEEKKALLEQFCAFLDQRREES